MKIKITPAMLRFMKSARLQRGGAWRAVRVGVLVMMAVVWAWVYLVSSPDHDTPTMTRDDWPSSPNLPAAPPIRDSLRVHPPPAYPQAPGGEVGEGKEENYIDGKFEKENGVHFINLEDGLKKTQRGVEGRGKEEENKRNRWEETNPRYHRGREEKMEGEKYEDDKEIPKIFPQRRIILPGDTGLVVEEEEDEEEEEEEEEGKWNGRNMEEKDNHAMEEVDEGLGIGREGDNGDNNDNDFVQEDVGGEAIKKKKKSKNKKRETNDRPETNKNNAQEKTHMNDLETNNHHHQLDVEKQKQGQRSKSDIPDLDLVAAEEEMRQRRARVKEVCARHGLGPDAPPGVQKVKYPPTPSYETFYIDRGDRLAWCPVYKAASTSWLYGFLSLAGISESYMRNTKEQVSTVARRMWPALPYEEAKEAMGMCVKALVVRHPFERLASAFRDKLERVAGGEKHGTEHFYQKYGRKIVEKYRKKETPGTKRDQPPPPPQRYSNALDDQPPPPPPPPAPPARYKHILDDSPPQPLHYNTADDPPQPPPPAPPQRYRHAIDDPPQPPSPQSKEPTFPEFVQYLIDTDLTLYADDHWMPYHISCTPCLLEFDVIAKFETLDRDQAYLLHKTHLQDKLKLTWRHLTKGNRTSDVVKQYFADVPKKHLLSLYGKYRLDFEMFDYSVADYLGYVKP